MYVKQICLSSELEDLVRTYPSYELKEAEKLFWMYRSRKWRAV